MGNQNVYFQPPANIQMRYPCIVYHRDYAQTQFGDNAPYLYTKRYQVTVIDRNPDSPIPAKVARLPLFTFIRFYTAGILNHGVLYIPNNSGVYENGYVWNGLVTVTESPSGAESSPQYADNIKYLNLVSAEEFGATVEAYTYPDEFMQCDGSASPTPGVVLGQ